MSEFCEYLAEIRVAAELPPSEVARRMGVDRNRVWAWESGHRRIQVDDLGRYLDAVGASPEQRLRALALASGGGHADPPTETESQAAPPAHRPVAPASVPTPEPQEVREVSDARPVVGTCGRSSCGGPLHALIEADVWRGVRCDDCELETDLERARPAAEAVQGAYRRNVA